MATNATESSNVQNYRRHVFGDTELCIPERYVDVVPRGVGAQGIVWWVKIHGPRDASYDAAGLPIFLSLVDTLTVTFIAY